MKQSQLAVVLTSSLLSCGGAAELIAEGATIEPAKTTEPGPRRVRSGVLIIALDGVSNERLQTMVDDGMLPGLRRLMNGTIDTPYDHTYRHPGLVTTMTSSTLVAWATIFTGEAPAVHGIVGNEIFLRRERHFVAPVPASVSSYDHLVDVYTDELLGNLLERDTLYIRARRELGASSWVTLNHVFEGADELLMFGSDIALDGPFLALGEEVEIADSYAALARIDDGAWSTLIDACDDAEVLPDIITAYAQGADGHAHAAAEGPREAIATYLVDVMDPLFSQLAEVLEDKPPRFIVVVADHGHTQVKDSEQNALSMDGPAEPPAILESAGFRVRPPELVTDETFDAVLAYHGALATLYLADRSACDVHHCDFQPIPRYEEDVLVAAEALHAANRSATGDAADFKGALELILVRRPRPDEEPQAPFSVYLGGGKTAPLESFLAAKPLPGKPVAFAERLDALTVGPFGRRAGDLLLLAKMDPDPERRHYFSEPKSSWHGGPERSASIVPLWVSRRDKTPEQLSALSTPALQTGSVHEVTPLVLRLLVNQ